MVIIVTNLIKSRWQMITFDMTNNHSMIYILPFPHEPNDK